MSTPLPTLDVVLPCYNEVQDIASCLDLLLAQRAELRHIIVVDNKSTDGTVAILHDYAAKHDVLVVVHEKRQGVQFARDTGMARATADIAARIDVDARVQPGWARAIREFYAAHPDVQAATGATEYFDLPARKFTNMVTWFFMTMSNQVIAGSVNLYGANMSIRREAWDTIADHLPDRNERVMEDLSISLALERVGGKIAYIPGAMAYVSGRRMRTSPSEFVRYNAQWPNTYRVMGYPHKARAIALLSWFGNVLQCGLAFLLQYHDPRTGRFSVRRVAPYEKRILP